MLTITRKTDYALIALAHMAARAGRVSSAREIAAAYGLPAALLMNILKSLHHHGLLQSTRGVKGGYQIKADLGAVSICDLIEIMECSGRGGDCGCGCHAPPAGAAQHLNESANGLDGAIGRKSGRRTKLNGAELVHESVQALRVRLQRFLKDVKLFDLIQPGRRGERQLEHNLPTGLAQRAVLTAVS
jgi:Rrf2 family protein